MSSFLSALRAPRTLSLWLPVLAYMAMLFVASSRPTTPTLPDAISYYHVHVAAYAGLGLLTARALARGLGRVTLSAFWGAVVIAFLYGVSDEYHQRFVPGRMFDVMDIVADGIGSAVGAGTAAAWGIIARRRHDPRRTLAHPSYLSTGRNKSPCSPSRDRKKRRE